MTAQPLFGVKQGCPLSPLLFSIYLNDIDSVTDGAQGALTGIFSLTVKYMLFADDLTRGGYPSNRPNMLLFALHLQGATTLTSIHQIESNLASHCC